MKALLKSTEVPRKLDKLAIVLSGTCLLHCLALPLLVTLVPIAQGSLLEEQTFHLLMLWIILPTSLLALTSGCWKHKDITTIALGTLGLVSLTLVALVGHDFLTPTGEKWTTVSAGLILAGAHIRNFTICQNENCSHDTKQATPL
jgi:hypothetical protein